jgi:hypothetical protein
MSRFRSKLAALLAVVVALTVAPALTSNAGAQTGTSKVWVTHGLPLNDSGTVVDVYVNGGLAIEDFTFGQTVGPLTLPAATYDIQVKLANTDTVAIDQDVAVPAGGNFSVVASYTNAEGAIGLNVFSNNLRKTGFFAGRLALHHAAAAPAVDVDLGLFPLSRQIPFFKITPVKNAPNGAQAALDAFSFLRYTVDVRVAGTPTTVLSVDNFPVREGRLNNVYVVGSAADGTLQAITSTIRL